MNRNDSLLFGHATLLATMLCLACGHTGAAPTAGGWRIVDKDDGAGTGWVMSSRGVPGSDFREFRIEGTVDAAPAAVFASARVQLTKDEHLPKGMKQRIISETEETLVTYYTIDMPFIFADRDFAACYDFCQGPSDGSFGLRWKEVPELAPPKPDGFVRIVATHGFWELKPASAGKTAVTFVQFADIGGSMPAWLVNRMGGDSLVEDLVKLRSLVAQRLTR